jgi:hypothetical protein
MLLRGRGPVESGCTGMRDVKMDTDKDRWTQIA